MKVFSITLCCLFIFVACKKSDDGASVSNFPDIEMEQGFDTLIVPVDLKNSTAGTTISVVDLPENMTAEVYALDSTRTKFSIHFITHYTLFNFEDTSLIPKKIIDTGVYKAKLEVADNGKIRVHPFSIHIIPHDVLSMAGAYIQNSNCPSATAINNKVNVEVHPVGNYWLISFQNILLTAGVLDTLDDCQYYNGTFVPQLRLTRSGNYPFQGTYIDGRLELRVFSCPVVLTRE